MELREIGKPKEAYVDEKCCLYSYVITRDYGFAPNPFGGICTLATCKPGIRNHATVGDWVVKYFMISLSSKEFVNFINASPMTTWSPICFISRILEL